MDNMIAAIQHGANCAGWPRKHQKEINMKPLELKIRLTALLGSSKLAFNAGKALGLDRVSIHRYFSGTRKIPGPVVSALRLAESCPPELRPDEWNE